MNHSNHYCSANSGTLIKVSIFAAMGLMAALFYACDSTSDPVTPKGRTVVATELPALGTASSLAVFGGGAGVTNQGTLTVIHGDLGTTGASTKITGFHSAAVVYSETPLNAGTVDGSVYSDAPAGSATDFDHAKALAALALSAFNSLAGLAGGIDPGAGQLGGLTLAPGLYKSAGGAFMITGSDLTLDAQGDANAIWVFQMASSLTVGGSAAPRSVILTHGALAKNIFWQVGSYATINSAGGGTMVGTILSSAGIAFSTHDNQAITTLNGRALALFASVTMVNTVIQSTF